MTENELRQKPVKWLEALNGSARGSAGHKKILQTFNSFFKGYTMTVSDPHCATTVSAAFIATGLTDIFPCVECSCNRMIELAKKAGIWVERDDYVPKTGDAVMYDWEDDGAGDNKGVADHVGLVVSCNGSKTDVIEGNMSGGKVGHRTINVNGKFIRGYITPKYASKATAADSKPAATTTTQPAAAQSAAAFKVGDVVKVVNAVNYDDGKPFKTYYGKYDVISVKGDRVVIGIGKTVVAPVKASNLALVSSGIKVGDKVKVVKAVTYDGKPFKTYFDKYDVISLKGDRAVIGIGKTVTADIKVSNLAKA